MKKLILFLLIISSAPVFAQKSIIPDKTSIINVLMKQQEAWNDGRIEDYMNGYWQNDSLTFIGKTNITKGWQQTLTNYKKSYPDKASMGTLQFDLISVEVLSQTSAYVIGKWQLKRNPEKGDLSGHFTLLFRKTDNQWVIVSDHSS